MTTPDFGEHPVYNRFPTQIIPESNHSPRWMPNRVTSSGADARIRRQSRPYWNSDLSGCKANEKQKDYIYALLYRNMGVRPVLNYVPTFCDIGTVVDRDFNGAPIVAPEVIGVGNGTPMQMQLRKRLRMDGYENEEIYYDVTKPHVGYPALEGLARTTHGPVPYQPMPELEVLRNGILVRRGIEYTVDRDTGIISHSMSGEISARGGFYILMLMPGEIPMSPRGNGVYEIKSGIRLEEVPQDYQQ